MHDSCGTGAATGSDSVCNGLDDDCDGSVDEAYIATTTSCGVGVCAASGSTDESYASTGTQSGTWARNSVRDQLSKAERPQPKQSDQLSEAERS